MHSVNRRQFLNQSARTFVSLAAGATLLSKPGPARADAANDKIRVGCIGLGGRGRGHASYFARHQDTEVVYVCDVDETGRVGRFPNEIERIQKKAPKVISDLRRILEDKDVDAVVISTCDHWHALATIWACQAGKDVYVEKPASNNLWEGRKMVEAARKYGRIVQVGSQNRSAPYIREALDYIQSGALGDIPLIKVFNLEPGSPYTEPPNSETPKGVDYDLYLGPAPMRPYNRGHFHDGWKNYWAYSGGDLADDGVHQLDIARMLIGDKPYPKAVNASGGNLAFQDDREVPDTQVVSYEYDHCVMTFELTQFAPYMKKVPGNVRDSDLFPVWPETGSRIELYGTKEIMYLGRHGGGWQAMTTGLKVTAESYGREASDLHRENFIQCIRSRALPNADIEIGHQSAVLVHLGNLGVRLGGRRLVYDGPNETVLNDPEALPLLTREYREPYVVPEEV